MTKVDSIISNGVPPTRTALLYSMYEDHLLANQNNAIQETARLFIVAKQIS